MAIPDEIKSNRGAGFPAPGNRLGSAVQMNFIRRMGAHLPLTRRSAQGRVPDPQLPALLSSSLPEVFAARLASMYAREAQLGEAGAEYPLDGVTQVSIEQGLWLHQLCLKVRPKKTLEIGLGYGFSTLYFLAAIFQNKVGHHTAVDPSQSSWHGVGLANVGRVGMESSFRFINDRSFPAFIDLGRAGEAFEIIFIDGSHKFDDVLVDFTLASNLCPQDGYVVLDDMWMPSIRKAVAFLRSNRTDFLSVETPVPNIAMFQRVAPDARPWDHFQDFIQ
jgi:predicted O-methyltransferase YrrM